MNTLNPIYDKIDHLSAFLPEEYLIIFIDMMKQNLSNLFV